MENYNKVKKDEYSVRYYLDDNLHRLYGPAIEWSNGDKEWYQNGLCHRIDGPAIEWVNGHKAWYQNGVRHRIDGHSVEWAGRYKEWYYEGEKINCSSQKEFERYIKLTLFC